MTGMLIAVTGIIRWRWSGLGLTFKSTEGLFGWKSHYRILSINFFLWKMIHAKSHAVFRAERDYAESFRLSVRSMLKKFNFMKVINTYIMNRIGNVLICSPLKLSCIYVITVILQYYLKIKVNNKKSALNSRTIQGAISYINTNLCQLA